MQTHREILGNGGLDGFSNYAGEVIPDNFLILMGRNRDSDILTNCNWDEAVRLLGDSARIDRIGHWAVGWIEYLSVDSNNEAALAVAHDIEDSLNCYPILNEDAYCEAEQQEADEVWRVCYSTRERIEYIRKFRDQFNFHDFADLRACVNGKYFVGYPGELLV